MSNATAALAALSVDDIAFAITHLLPDRKVYLLPWNGGYVCEGIISMLTITRSNIQFRVREVLRDGLAYQNNYSLRHLKEGRVFLTREDAEKEWAKRDQTNRT